MIFGATEDRCDRTIYLIRKVGRAIGDCVTVLASLAVKHAKDMFALLIALWEMK